MRYPVLLLLATLLVAATLVHSKAIDTNSLHKLHTPVYENCYSHDGINVNKKHVTWGRTGEIVPRLSKAAYLDGVKDPPRLSLSARVISNAFCKQTTCDETNDFNVSSMIYAYGQFVDHDISNEGTGLKFTETLNIEVPAGDVWTTPLPFTRAVFASDKPTYLNEPVNPVNFVTGYMDCSQIYGSDEVRAEALRSKVGGLLKTDLQFGKEFLPKSFVDTNTGLFFIGAGNNTVIAGDNRATEALPISIMQTLFLREHNRLARLIVSRFGVAQNRLTNPTVDSWIYETARTINCAQIQHITYTEYLPRLLGKFSPKPSNLCYDEEVKATVTSEFSTAAFRFGHSTVGCDLKRFLKNGTELTPIDFGAAFNAYPVLLQNNGEEIDNLVRGLVKHHAQNLDEKVVDGLRQQIRGRLDLVARNIQRGRDVGLPDYNTIRQAVGLPALNVTQITTRVDIQTKLISFWGTNLVGLEPWLGVILEDKVGNSQLGELGTLLLKTQFESFVKGDPCFYSHSQKWATTLFRKEIQKVTLADIIDANTGVKKNEKAMGESPFTAKYGPLI